MEEKIEHYREAAKWLEAELEAVAMLENDLLDLLKKFQKERDELGGYDASATAIITLVNAVCALAGGLRTAMRAHLATERARG